MKLFIQISVLAMMSFMVRSMPANIPTPVSKAPDSLGSALADLLAAGAGGAHDAWKTKQCTEPQITDATNDPSKRWASVDTEDAWSAASNYASEQIILKKNNGLSFPELVSNFFHGTEDMNCEDIVNHNGCNQPMLCFAPPAGYLILNSFVAISNLNDNIYTAINDANGIVKDKLGSFSTTFAAFDDNESALKIILDLIGLGYALIAAPIWNIALKESAIFAGLSNELGTLKDTINPIVSNGITLAKDSSVAGESINAENDLSTNLGNLVDQWGAIISSYNRGLFSGNASALTMLHSQISNGAVIAGNFAVDGATVGQLVQKTIFGIMIPQAWALGNGDVHPVIIDSGDDCSDPTAIPDYIDQAAGNNVGSCVTNRMYYLVSASGPGETQTGGGAAPVSFTQTKFSAPPGLPSIDDKNWGGLSTDDITAGSVISYGANGNKNGGAPMSITPGTAPSDDILTDILTNGVRAAGIFNIPVCTVKEAQENWIGGKKGGNYPCN